MGLVINFDGEIWRLHGGKYGEVVYEIIDIDLHVELKGNSI